MPQAQPAIAADGDQAFYRVDTRRPAHELPAGVAADAVNCRFEDGRPWTRFGIAQEPWGAPVTATGKVVGFIRFNDPQGFDVTLRATDDWRSALGEDGGRGRLWRILPGNGPVPVPLNGHDIWDTVRLIPCFNGVAMLRQGNERHYFSAVTTLAITGSDATAETLAVNTATLATGSPVTVTGITGASGLYYVKAVNGPAVSLYDTAAHAIAGGATGRFNVTVNGQSGTLNRLAVDPAASTIQLNDTPTWNAGDKVYYQPFDGASNITGAAGKNPPNPGAGYYVKPLPGNLVKLYSDAALTTQMTFTTAVGRFYLERAADFPGFYGNGAPPLLARPNASGNTWLDQGMALVPVNIVVTSTSNSGVNANVLTVPQHGLLPGNAVTVAGIHTTGGALIAGTVYANPISPNAVILYTTALAALAGGLTNQIPLAVAGETGSLTQAGSTGLPMPSGREGCYFQNRLLVVNASDTLMISDPLDPLHFSPFVDAITANLGTSDPITALWPYGSDSVLILRNTRVDILNNLSGGPDAWTLTNITAEYGCIAPLSIAQTGADVWFLSRKGIASITQTTNGAIQGVAEPVSKAMQKYIDQIDWRYASQAAAGYWNNRYIVALPLKGQVLSGTATIQNNGILSHNFLNVATTNGGGAGSYQPMTEFGWEGLWTGTGLTAYAFARNTIYGEERLTFCNYAGQVCWLGDDFMDGTATITTTLTTRRYTGGGSTRKLWLDVLVNVDTYTPTLTITAIFPGVNETVVLANNKTFDPTLSTIYGQSAYNPATATPATFGAPYRQDYKMTVGELLAGAPETHQNTLVPLRLRRTAWGMQLQIVNTTGSARLQAVEVSGRNREFTSTGEA